MQTLLKWLLRLALLLVGFVVLIFVGAGLAPANADPLVAPADYGAGSSSVEPSTTGLLREFPPLNAPEENPQTPEKIALGQALFFDPILSENNERACASCHHPDRGFSDGRATAEGVDGSALARNTPSLWNVGYAKNMFWDGRLQSLEAQAELPLTHPDEMGVSDVDALLAELEELPAYSERFAAAFPDEGITLDTVEKALAAFQRSLQTNDSPFDRYAAGDFNALSASQRRGLALFRSGATRCFECHTPPTFASDTFRIVGIPSDDPGRAAVADDGDVGAFKVPSLRNVALSGPYMHDGSLKTLEAVVEFYADGGGRVHERENIDPFVQGFELTEQEKEDLVAFLYALTDESQLPEIPTAVPSGLPPVVAVNNPERELVAAHNVGGDGSPAVDDSAPRTITVAAGEPIQTAVDQARPGDTVEIPYAVYHERVVVDISDLTLRGIPNANGEFPIIDGEFKLPEGVLSSGNNFTISHLHLKNFTDNGVLVEGVNNVHFHDLLVEDTGAYGVYPVQSSGVLIERVTVSGSDDAGIYAGQCEEVIVRDNVAFGNVIGIELENTISGEVYNNHTYENTTGIFLVLLPQLTSKVSQNAKVYNNLVEDNNVDNFGRAGATVSLLPPGVGILILASDHNAVYNNTITGNKSSGVAVFSLTGTGQFDVDELDIGPLPEGNWVYDNSYANNGYDPDQFIKDLGIPVGDILWDGSGTENRFDEENVTAFPPLLPSDSWPQFARRSYENILSFVIGLIG